MILKKNIVNLARYLLAWLNFFIIHYFNQKKSKIVNNAFLPKSAFFVVRDIIYERMKVGVF